MAFSNNMTKLINKIERRLGTSQLNLPDHLKKDKWGEIIEEDSLSTYSRYFPNKVIYELSSSDMKNGYYLIDEERLPPGTEILGAGDIAWDDPQALGIGGYVNSPQYNAYDTMQNPYNLEDMALMQMRADELSLFNNGIFVEYTAPNKIKLSNCMGMNFDCISYRIYLFIKHSSNLNTIYPTQMETFEALAKADIATWLYQELKYYDNLETVFGTVDIKLSDLQDQAMRREDIVARLDESHVSMANTNQPGIMCI